MKLTPERIAELHKFNIQNNFDLIRTGMRMGLIPWQNKITLKVKVRKLRNEQ